MLALCALCLLCIAATAQAAPAPQPAKSGTELEEAIEANVEAQDYQEETTAVRAQIVKGEPAALIASGTGDISTTGDLPSSHAPAALQICLYVSLLCQWYYWPGHVGLLPRCPGWQ